MGKRFFTKSFLGAVLARSSGEEPATSSRRASMAWRWEIQHGRAPTGGECVGRRGARFKSDDGRHRRRGLVLPRRALVLRPARRGCRGARLQGDGSKTTYEAHSGKRSVEFSASPWDWPQTLGTDVAEELYKGETVQFRREGAEGIATKICKGNVSCAALPGASITLRLTEAASIL